jgi:hypothetical protein
MYKNLKIIALLIVGCAVLLGGVMLAVQLSSPTGNVGDEGVIAIPVLLFLVGFIIFGVCMSLVYLIKERPKGGLLILPFSILLMAVIPILVLSSISKSREKKQEEHWNELSISKTEAIDLIRACKVRDIDHNYPMHPGLELKGSYEVKYVFLNDISDIESEMNLAKTRC